MPATHSGAGRGYFTISGKPPGNRCLPNWGIKSYVDHDYVIARRIGANGLWSDLFISAREGDASLTCLQDFVTTNRDQCFATLEGAIPLE
ncbi:MULTISPECIES: type 2 periplasmic-binding domain-containing protein [Nitrosomonas]|uniref:hypothetical protein n=1 Tax=Nitrosomonas TaxID=914 RepID=UPI001F406439|nr:MULTISPECIES: hypothetical protein [Nitrosomonas]UVS62721.1 hypothetical protein NX761_06305 [Nitrosomonas sp. PLL12]